MSRGGARAAVVGAAALLAACRHPAPLRSAPVPREGLALALYDRDGRDAYGVVDDRRWLDVTGDMLVIEPVDPRAALPSLVIEPLARDRLAGAPFAIGACTRDRIPHAPPAPRPAVTPIAPVSEADAAAAPGEPGAAPAHAPFAVSPALRCAVHAAPGRYFVRVLYVIPGLGYRAFHDVALTAGDRASVASRFAFATPAWRRRAEITLFDGTPGGERPAHEVARGTAMLDGGTAVLTTPAHPVAARLRRIYEGAAPVPASDDTPPRDLHWRQAAQGAIWLWLELAGTDLAPGVVHAHVAEPAAPARDQDVAAAATRRTPAGTQVPLWIDDELHGKRDRRSRGDPVALIDTFELSVASTAGQPREVWIEEPLRTITRRAIVHAWPGAPIVAGDRVRMALTVGPGKIERGGFEIVYAP